MIGLDIDENEDNDDQQRYPKDTSIDLRRQPVQLLPAPSSKESFSGITFIYFLVNSFLFDCILISAEENKFELNLLQLSEWQFISIERFNLCYFDHSFFLSHRNICFRLDR